MSVLSEWVSVLSEWVSVLSEWVRCRIFELVKGQSNKRSQKPPKAYLHPIYHHHYEKDHRAKGLFTEGYHARGASTKKIKLYNVIGNHANLIAIHLPS